MPERDMNMSAALNSYYQQYASGDTRATGPSVTVGKSFLQKQLKSNWSLSYNVNQQAEAKASQVYSARWNISFQSNHKRERDTQQKLHHKSVTASNKTSKPKKSSKGYIRETSTVTGQELPESLSMPKEETRVAKSTTTETDQATKAKRSFNERHRFNMSVLFTHRDVPTAATPKFSELTIRISYAYTF